MCWCIWWRHNTIRFPLQDELFRWTFRLIGIDTPEIRNKNKKEKTFGYTVRDNLREQILNKVVTVKCKDFDKYGRLLVHIYLEKDTPSINEWLIDNKFAFSYDGRKKKNWVEYLNNTNEW